MIATARVLENRRAIVQAAREATARDDSTAAADAAPPNLLTQSRRASPLEQTIRVATAWAFVMPLLLASPFLAYPPAWIALLSQLPANGGNATPSRNARELC